MRTFVLVYHSRRRFGKGQFRRRQKLSKEFELVDDDAGLRRAVASMVGQPRIGFDLESNGFFRYPERVCLIQVSTRDRVFVIDPLDIEDMSPMGKVLASGATETILHAGSHDVTSLDRDWGFHIDRMFDTHIAAGFVGMAKRGLAPVLEGTLGVNIPKDKSIQRSDWTKRPLNAKSLEYAASDVRYLLDARAVLDRRLRRLGRMTWVIEESRRLSETRYVAPDPDMAVFKVKGAGALDGRGMAILKELVEYREDLAVTVGKPHFRVMPDMALVSLAANPKQDFGKVRGLGRHARGRSASELRKAIKRGESADPPVRPAQPKGRRQTRTRGGGGYDRRFSALKRWRVGLGERLSLDPALLWPMASLQRIARAPDNLDAELQEPEVRKWQRREFEESLRRELRGVRR